MKKLFVISYPRSGQSLFIHAVQCLDHVWTQAETKKPFQCILGNDLFVNKERFAPDIKTGLEKVVFYRGHVPMCSDPFIHVVRDPRDVFCSYARYVCKVNKKYSYAQALEIFAKGKAASFKGVNTLPKSWGDYIEYAESNQMRMGTVLYEEMIVDPVEKAQRALMQAGWLTKKAREMPPFKWFEAKSDWYYKRGRSGYYKQEMPKKIQDIVVKANGEIMKKFGYA
jgi:hypothetical protein